MAYSEGIKRHLKLEITRHESEVTGVMSNSGEPIRIKKAKESMLAAIQCFNNPFACYREETYLQLALVAWTHCVHEKLANANVSIKNKRDPEKYLYLRECIDKKEAALSDKQKKLLKELIDLRNCVVHDGSASHALSKEYLKLTQCALDFKKYFETFGSTLGLESIPFYAISLSKLEEMDESKLKALITDGIACKGGGQCVEKQIGGIVYVEGGSHAPPPGITPTGIVKKLKEKIKHANMQSFKVHNHTELWKALKAKKGSAYGHYVTEENKDWVWNEYWLKVVEQIVRRYFLEEEGQHVDLKIDLKLDLEQEKALQELGEKYSKKCKKLQSKP
jgi:hypothetical protein